MIYLTNVGQLIRDVWGGSKRAGSFSQNYLAVLSGTGVNILVQVFVSPLLTRIYGPEAYGIYALFTALCTNIAVVATLRFPQAFLLPRDERDFYSLLRISLISSCGASVLVFLGLLWNGEAFLKLLQAESLLPYIYLVPVMIFLVALNQIFGQWQYRLDAFKKSVAIDTSLLIGVRIFNLAFGWLSHGLRIGLVLGDGLGKVSGLLLSAKFIIKRDVKKIFMSLSFGQLKKVFVTYRAYPLLNLPGIWLVLTSEQLPFFLLSTKFGLPAIGFLALSISILDLPKRLFAYSVSSVFYKKAVDLYAQSFAQFQAAVIKMFYGLFLLSAIPYAAIFNFGPLLFSFVFGADWEMSGRLAQYLALYYVLELLCISFDSVFYILRKEKQLFYFQVAAFAGRLMVLLWALHAFETLEGCVALLMAFNLLLYSAQLLTILYSLKLAAHKYFFQAFSVMALLISVFAAGKMFWNYLFQ
jgi:O-antigen/teichoic acid export membrane protein